MIFHTVNTITIGQYAELLSIRDNDLIKRINIPVLKSQKIKAIKKLNYDFNKLISGNEFERLIRKDLNMLNNLIKLNIQYPMLLKLSDMLIKYKTEEIKNNFNTIYKAIYGVDANGKIDHSKIITDYELFKNRILQKQAIETINSSTNDSVSFELILAKTEMILAPLTLREKKLYTLPIYFDLAAKKITHGRN